MLFKKLLVSVPVTTPGPSLLERQAEQRCGFGRQGGFNEGASRVCAYEGCHGVDGTVSRLIIVNWSRILRVPGICVLHLY